MKSELHILLLFSLICFSCSQKTYYTRLYGGYMNTSSLTKYEKKEFKKEFVSEYYLLQKIEYKSKIYKVMTTNLELYLLLKNNNLISSYKSFVQKMVSLKLKKEPLGVESEAIFNSLITNELTCNDSIQDMHLTTKKIMDKYYDKLGFIKNDFRHENFMCLEAKLLENEKIFIEVYEEGDIRVTNFKNLKQL